MLSWARWGWDLDGLGKLFRRRRRRRRRRPLGGEEEEEKKKKTKKITPSEHVFLICVKTHFRA